MHKDATNSRMKRDGTIGAQTETETETETRFWVGATACTRPAASGDTAGERTWHLRRCGRLGYSGDGYGIEWGDAGSRYITTMTRTGTGTAREPETKNPRNEDREPRNTQEAGTDTGGVDIMWMHGWMGRRKE